MPEDLQALIDHLQHDAVEEGQRRARELIDAAEAKAAARLRAAEAEGARLVAQAERDAAVYTERSTVALEQAGRDLLITVRRAIDDLLAGLLREELVRTLSPDLLADLLVRMADAYTAHGGRERRMSVLLNADDLDALVRFAAQRYRERLAQGIELRLDPDASHGFRIEFVDEHVTHDFTVDAIVEELSGYLSPRLAELLPRAAVRLARAEAPEASDAHDAHGAPEAR
jgi:V/A-type H+-transporting ATPase subunit E